MEIKKNLAKKKRDGGNKGESGRGRGDRGNNGKMAKRMVKENVGA